MGASIRAMRIGSTSSMLEVLMLQMWVRCTYMCVLRCVKSQQTLDAFGPFGRKPDILNP